MRNVLCILLLYFFASCSENQLDDAKISFAKEAARATEGAFVNLAKNNLTKEDFANLSCDSEAKYYGAKIETKLKELLKVNPETQQKALVGSACRAVLPIAINYAIKESELKPCAKKVGHTEILKLGDMACSFLDTKI